MSNQQGMNLASAKFGPKGWALCVYMFFIFYLNTSMNTGWQNCLTYWETTYGWDTTTLLSLVSVAQFVGIAACFVTGRLALKVSPRLLAIVWGVVVTASCFCINLVHNMVLFGIVECVAIMGQVVWAYTLNPIFVSSWFPRKKGVVMGITTIGVPLGAGTTSKIMNWIGANWGLNYCLTFVGLIGLVGLLLLIFVVRDTPEEAGCKPDNDDSLTSEDVRRMAAEAREQDMKSPWTTGRMLRLPQTYIIALTMGCGALFGGGVMGTAVIGMLSRGYETGTAVNMMLLSAACACVFSYIFGVIDAKYGARIGEIGVFICAICASLCLMLGTSMPMQVVGMVLTGAVTGGAANFCTSLVIEYWGPANFKRAYGVIYPIHQIPGSMGTLFIVQIAARFGGYTVAYGAMAAAMVLAMVIFIVCTNKGGVFVKNAEEKWGIAK